MLNGPVVNVGRQQHCGDFRSPARQERTRQQGVAAVISTANEQGHALGTHGFSGYGGRGAVHEHGLGGVKHGDALRRTERGGTEWLRLRSHGPTLARVGYWGAERGETSVLA